MKIEVKETKQEFKPVKLELTFESKREIEVLGTFLTPSYGIINKYMKIHHPKNKVSLTRKEDNEIISPIHMNLQEVLESLKKR